MSLVSSDGRVLPALLVCWTFTSSGTRSCGKPVIGLDFEVIAQVSDLKWDRVEPPLRGFYVPKRGDIPVCVLTSGPSVHWFCITRDPSLGAR